MWVGRRPHIVHLFQRDLPGARILTVGVNGRGGGSLGSGLSLGRGQPLGGKQCFAVIMPL